MNTAATELDIKPVTLGDLAPLREALSHYRGRLCDLSAGNALFWRDYYGISLVRLEGGMALGYGNGRFSLPFGKDPDKALAALISAEPHASLVNLTKEEADDFMSRFPQAVLTSEGRDFCDYLYNASDIVNLIGKRFAGQRNHINKFTGLYPDALFAELSEESLPLARDFCRRYFEDFGKKTEVSDYEYRELLYQLDHWEAYGQCGGLLIHEGRAIALSAGEVVGDTLIVHTEKADISYAGVYPMMVRSFARAFVTDTVRYINREEDMGDAGLRTSKLSYHPVMLAEKFSVTL